MSSGLDQVKLDRLIKQKGSIMIELVFCVSMLAVIFMATVTFSFLFSDYYSAQKVAREGAREASITKNIVLAREKALSAAWLWGMASERIDVRFITDSTTVTCTVEYIARPYSKTFPALVKGKALEDYRLRTRATYVWSDTRS